MISVVISIVILILYHGIMGKWPWTALFSRPKISGELKNTININPVDVVDAEWADIICYKDSYYLVRDGVIIADITYDINSMDTISVTLIGIVPGHNSIDMRV